MEQDSSSSASSSTAHLGNSPAIDRHNPIISDHRRNAKPLSTCNNFQPPINPKIPKIQHKNKNKNIPLKESYDQSKIKNRGNEEATYYGHANGAASIITPPSSTRYLLSSDKVYLDSSLDFDPNLNLVTGETSKSGASKTNKLYDAKPEPSSFPAHQVVVLKVSLHCRGCERKMKKHISRMEGVTSFNIDFAAKKVTVTGNVTPLSVLSSISKVKNAQLWPPTISSSIPTALNLSNSEFKNGYKAAGA